MFSILISLMYRFKQAFKFFFLEIWIFEYFEYSEQCVNRVGELKREMICLGYFARPLFDKANDSVDKNACE